MTQISFSYSTIGRWKGHTLSKEGKVTRESRYVAEIKIQGRHEERR